MQAVLIVNPAATTTSSRTQKVLASALSAQFAVEVAETQYRGHAMDLAREAAESGAEAVAVLSGDGTVNEVVNGLVGDGRSADDAPLFIPIPGGSTNVFARALGLPADAMDAAAMVMDSMRARRYRRISLGRAAGRLFTFCAGLGWDAAVIRRVEEYRERGKQATPGLYFRAGLAELMPAPTRHDPEVVLEFTDGTVVSSQGTAVIQNTAPWTYLGELPVNLNARASFNAGLDVLLVRKLGLSAAAARSAAQVLAGREAPSGKQVVSYHDLDSFRLRLSRPEAFQLDGDYLGEFDNVEFHAIPNALRVVC